MYLKKRGCEFDTFYLLPFCLARKRILCSSCKGRCSNSHTDVPPDNLEEDEKEEAE